MTDDRSPEAAVRPEDRPRPAYGEYSTVEEQRARIQQPDLTYALDTGQDPDRVTATMNPTAAPRRGRAPSAAASRTGRRRADLIVAWVLLGYGFVNVVLTVLSLRDFTGFADQFFRTAGIEGEFTNVAAGVQWGATASVVLGVGWLLTAVATYLASRRGMLVWWIPVVGAVVSIALSTVCLSIPLMTDPAVLGFFGPTP